TVDSRSFLSINTLATCSALRLCPSFSAPSILHQEWYIMNWKQLFRLPARRSATKRPIRLSLEILEDRLTPSVSFLGVGAGDATNNDAILWTRAQDSSSSAGVGLITQVSTDPTFAAGQALPLVATEPAHDYTIHVDATGLQPGTRYYYRFVADGAISQIGTFVTAPSATANAPVSFGFTGDADGLMRPYDATNSANFAPPNSSGVGSQNFDYLIWLGDTIYETASGQGTPNF